MPIPSKTLLCALQEIRPYFAVSDAKPLPFGLQNLIAYSMHRNYCYLFSTSYVPDTLPTIPDTLPTISIIETAIVAVSVLQTEPAAEIAEAYSAILRDTLHGLFSRTV